MRFCQRVFALFFCCCLLFSMFLSAVPVTVNATVIDNEGNVALPDGGDGATKDYEVAKKGLLAFFAAINYKIESFVDYIKNPDNLPSLLFYYFGDLGGKIVEVTDNIKNLPTNLKAYFEDLGDKLKELPSNLKTYFDDLGTKIKNLPANIGTWINNLATRVELALDNKVKPVINSGISRIEYVLEDIIKPTLNSVSSRVEAALDITVGGYFTNLKNNISSFFTDLGTKIKNIPTDLKQYFDDLGTKLKDLPTNLKNFFDDLGIKIKNLPTDLKQFFDDLGSKISNLASALGLPSWLSDLKDSVSSSFIVTTFQRISEWFQGLFSFFDSPSMSDDGEHKNFFDYLFGTTGSKDDFWSWFRDLEFQYYIQEFYWSISLFWTALPLAIRYLILFGFGFPFMFCIIKAFAR